MRPLFVALLPPSRRVGSYNIRAQAGVDTAGVTRDGRSPKHFFSQRKSRTQRGREDALLEAAANSSCCGSVFPESPVMVGAGANCRPVTVSTRKVEVAVGAGAGASALAQMPVASGDGRSVASATSTDEGPPDMEALQIGRILNAMEAVGSVEKTPEATSGANGKVPHRKSWVVSANKESFKAAGKKGERQRG